MNQGGQMEFNYLQRVKVYRLNDDGKWDDKGTGHVSVEYLERSDAVGLVVIDEDDNATLLVHRISADDIYQRQEDTIISWTDPEVATDLALSFQETVGCEYIWEQICKVQRQIQFPSVSPLESAPRHLADDLEHSGTSQDDDDVLHVGGNDDATDLPPVDLNNLGRIVKVVTEVSPFHRDRVAAMVDSDYVTSLLELFRICEDLENMEGLHLLYKIVRGLILLNDGHIFTVLLSDKWILDGIGALEYDPDAPEHQPHRTYLKEQVFFKEAVPIRDPDVLSKIHQTYRIGYIKDVILPRALDDQTAGTLNSLMLFNNLEVVTGLHMDRPFMTDLFQRLIQGNPTDPSWKVLVLFLQEFCNLHKQLPPAQRNQYLGELVSAGLLEIVTTGLQHKDDQIRLAVVDILMATLNPDPAAVRMFLVEQVDHKLFGLLIEGMVAPGEGGLQLQLLEMLRLLLDSDTMDGADKNKFLDVFYEKYVDKLAGSFSSGRSQQAQKAGATGEQQQMVASIPADVLGNLVELLCFCVQHHSFRIKYYVLRNNVVEKVMRLLRRKEKYLVVAAIRFLRTCIGLKDEFYFRYLVKNNLFDPVIQAFVENGPRYNLLNSAVIEMVDFIRKENIKSLIAHLVEKYGSQFAEMDYVETFKQLELKYEQSKEGPPQEEAPAAAHDPAAAPAGVGGGKELASGRMRVLGPARQRKDDRALDNEEESYFNEDSDDEEDTASAPQPPKSDPPQTAAAVVVNGTSVPGEQPSRSAHLGLVDYDDEDDEPLPLPCPPIGTNGILGTHEEERQEAAAPARDSSPVKRLPPNPAPEYECVSPGKKRRMDMVQVPENGGRGDAQPVPEVSGRGNGGARDGTDVGMEGDWFDQGFEWRGGGRGAGSPRIRGPQKLPDRQGGFLAKQKQGGGQGGGLIRVYVSPKDSDHGSRRSEDSVADLVRNEADANGQEQVREGRNGASPGWGWGEEPSNGPVSEGGERGEWEEGARGAGEHCGSETPTRVGVAGLSIRQDSPSASTLSEDFENYPPEVALERNADQTVAAEAGLVSSGLLGSQVDNRKEEDVPSVKKVEARRTGEAGQRQALSEGTVTIELPKMQKGAENDEHKFGTPSSAIKTDTHSEGGMNFNMEDANVAEIREEMTITAHGDQDTSLGGLSATEGSSLGGLGTDALCATQPPEPYPVR